MSRRHAAVKRVIAEDSKYGSLVIAKFINKIMEQGKKALAEKIVYQALAHLERKHKIQPLEAFNTAIGNVRPSLEVTSVRVGGANYQVPSVVNDERGRTLAIRWIIDAARKRSEKTMSAKIAEELFDAYNSKGAAMKKREDILKMAESNRAFLHLTPKKANG